MIKVVNYVIKTIAYFQINYLLKRSRPHFIRFINARRNKCYSWLGVVLLSILTQAEQHGHEEAERIKQEEEKPEFFKMHSKINKAKADA